MRQIERAAGGIFATVGLEAVARDEPPSVAELRGYVDGGRIWVIAVGSRPAGFALVDVLDGHVHLEQLSVDPEYGRRGLGAALLEHVCAWAAQAGYTAVTLTTFEHLRWNAPFYAAHGFTALATTSLGPELRSRRDEEAEHGLDPALRVCMRRRLDA